MPWCLHQQRNFARAEYVICGESQKRGRQIPTAPAHQIQLSCGRSPPVPRGLLHLAVALKISGLSEGWEISADGRSLQIFSVWALPESTDVCVWPALFLHTHRGPLSSSHMSHSLRSRGCAMLGSALPKQVLGNSLLCPVSRSTRSFWVWTPVMCPPRLPEPAEHRCSWKASCKGHPAFGEGLPNSTVLN